MTLDSLRDALDADARGFDAPVPAASLRRSRWALLPLHLALLWEAAWGVAAVGLLGAFLVAHRAAPPAPLASALLLLAGALLYSGATVRQFALLGRVDYAAPVAGVQRRLAALGVLRARTVGGVLVAAPLVWLPALIVGVWALAGVDVTAVMSPAWIVANLALGVLVLGAGVWVARRAPAWVEWSPWLRRIADHLAGRSLARARAHAAEAAAFAADEV
ncbi:MAG TPA: hypothetical protein VK610_04035 [Rhodothermales bacterium]|nr:hypothetical protein [Rhodothermales bacterium]